MNIPTFAPCFAPKFGDIRKEDIQLGKPLVKGYWTFVPSQTVAEAEAEAYAGVGQANVASFMFNGQGIASDWFKED